MREQLSGHLAASRGQTTTTKQCLKSKQYLEKPSICVIQIINQSYTLSAI